MCSIICLTSKQLNNLNGNIKSNSGHQKKWMKKHWDWNLGIFITHSKVSIYRPVRQHKFTPFNWCNQPSSELYKTRTQCAIKIVYFTTLHIKINWFLTSDYVLKSIIGKKNYVNVWKLQSFLLLTFWHTIK